MSILKTIEREKITFLMDFDYNNVLGRLKYALGKEASFFADIRVRKNDVTWSTKDFIEFKSLSEASENEKDEIRTLVDSQIEKIKSYISKDSLIGDLNSQITTYPSEQFVYYAHINGVFKVVLTGWGCKYKLVQDPNDKDSRGSAPNDNPTHRNIQEDCSMVQTLMGATEHVASRTLKTEYKKVSDGFFINDHKKNNLNKEKKTYSKKEICKSVILILLAAFIALIIPVLFTGAINRLVANVTGQWYLNGFSRVLITLFMAITTYSVAYLLIWFTILKKSIVFNVVCFILTFIWSIFMGIIWMPD